VRATTDNECWLLTHLPFCLSVAGSEVAQRSEKRRRPEGGVPRRFPHGVLRQHAPTVPRLLPRLRHREVGEAVEGVHGQLERCGRRPGTRHQRQLHQFAERPQLHPRPRVPMEGERQDGQPLEPNAQWAGRKGDEERQDWRRGECCQLCQELRQPLRLVVCHRQRTLSGIIHYPATHTIKGVGFFSRIHSKAEFKNRFS
jgi:hypothetical protein